MALNRSLVVKLLCVATCFILLLSASYGFFRSWDFFTLWGIHPKWVWSTGEFFTPGFQLPTNIAYQSFWGSLLGGILHYLEVRTYPDLLWGFLIGLASVFLVFRMAPRSDQSGSLGRILICLTFVMLYPREFRQISFGGYVDLAYSLLLAAMGLCLLQKRSSLIFAILGSLVVLTKITAWPWVVVVLVSGYVSGNVKTLRFAVLPIAALVLTLLFFRFSYSSGSAAPDSLAPMGFGVTNYSIWDRLRLPFAIITTQNGWVLGLLFMSFKLRKEMPLALYFIIFGLLLLCGHYTFILGSTPYERYASINRYALPLALIPTFLLAHRGALWLAWFRGHIDRVLVVGLGLVLLVRGFEEINYVNRYGFWSRFKVCQSGDSICRAAEIAKQRQRENPECDFLVASSNWFDEHIGTSQGDLNRLVVVYQALPTRVYLPSSVLPQSQERRCELE